MSLTLLISIAISSCNNKNKLALENTKLGILKLDRNDPPVLIDSWNEFEIQYKNIKFKNLSLQSECFEIEKLDKTFNIKPKCMGYNNLYLLNKAVVIDSFILKTKVDPIEGIHVGRLSIFNHRLHRAKWGTLVIGKKDIKDKYKIKSFYILILSPTNEYVHFEEIEGDNFLHLKKHVNTIGIQIYLSNIIAVDENGYERICHNVILSIR